MMITKSTVPKRKVRKLWKLTYTVFLVIALLAMNLPLSASAEAADPANIIYVKASAAAGGNGASWDTAYNDLETALAIAASGAQIWVAEGTYNPGPESYTFTLKNGVAIYGGFAGTETQLSQRNADPASNNTTLSRGYSTTYHVVTAPVGTDATAILDGFTIANGYAATLAGGPADSGRGGGLLVYGSPTLDNLIVRNNTASQIGGGMYIDGGSPTLTNVVFTENTAARGGGLAIHNGSPTMTGIKFDDNNTTLYYGGGGMHIVGGNTTLSNAIFSNNTSPSGSGRGGGLHLTSISELAGDGDFGNEYETSLSLFNVVFAGNAGAYGGGMYTSGGAATLVNVSFTGNNAHNNGGGLYVGTREVTKGGGVVVKSTSSVIVINSILWGNTGGVAPQIAVDATSSLDVSYSCVQGSGGSFAWSLPEVSDGGHNIDAFPFVNSGDPEEPYAIDWDGSDNIFGTWDDGLRLPVGSPAVDAGSNAAVSGVATDIVGAPRIRDGNGDGMPRVDMGVFESETALRGVIYVDKGAKGANNGSSWSDAFTDLQHALLVAKSDSTTEVWVAAGTYLPTVGTDRVGTFHLRNGVKIYGGFAGNETAREQRDPAVNETILSGDLLRNDTSNFVNRSDNSYHVVSAYGWVDASAVLDGFTISGGNANVFDSRNFLGGGLYNLGSPTLANLWVVDNTAANGGGMYIGGGNPMLTAVTFKRNHGSNAGGGIFLVSGNPVLTNVTLEGNDCTDGGGGGGNGGGMFVGEHGGSATLYAGTLTLSNVIFKDNAAQFAGGLQVRSGDVSLSDVTFSENRATGKGGGMIAGDHDFLMPYTGNLTLTDVSFLGNSAVDSMATGGGMLMYEASPKLTNVIFRGNYSGSHGGGLALVLASPTLTNVTFAGNAATTGGAVYAAESSQTITNSILWGNTGGEIVNQYGGSPTISYSIVQGGYTGEGNKNTDPMFVSSPASSAPTTSGDLRLQAASPAIDAGNNFAAGLTGITTDLDGNPRFVDGNGNSTATVDMGAYEYQGDITAPTITSIEPTFGSTAGGTAVTITGTNFVEGAAVHFGGTAATDVIVTSATSITANTPVHEAGPVDVVVTNSDNQSGTLTNGFAYVTFPIVTTGDVTNITATSATGNGNVTSDGGSAITERGIVWATTADPTTADNKDTAEGTTGAFTAALTELTPGTLYYVRAYATNSVETSYGSEVTFTAFKLPIVTTQAVSSIGATMATGNGNVTELGVPNPTQHGVVWSTSESPTLSNSYTTEGAVSSTGAFTSSMTGLTESTTYYVRAYATNAAGTVYGGQVTFTIQTSATAPTVTTQAVTEIATTTATGNGNVTSDGGSAITERGIVWATSENPAITTNGGRVIAVGTIGAFTGALTDLTPGTLYYVRAYATNAIGTSYGNEVTFTAEGVTTDQPPIIITQPQNKAVELGEQAIFNVEYTSNSEITFQWQLSTKNIRRWSNIAGANSDTYDTPAATSEMNGYKYRVILSNKFGSVTSEAATLTVTAEDPPEKTEADVEIAFKAGTYDPETNTVTWTITVTNNGPYVAEGVVVTDKLSNKVLAVTTDYNYKLSGKNVIVEIGTLSYGESVDITIVEALPKRATGDVTNTATVTTTSDDPNLVNNTFTAIVVLE